MRLTGAEIKKNLRPNIWQKLTGQPANITIIPFDEKCLGPNNYDIHLYPELKVFTATIPNGMKPALEFIPGHEYSMRDWFVSDEAYAEYLAHPENFDQRNPKFMVNPFENKETVSIMIPKDGLILSPQVGYLGATVECVGGRNLIPSIDGKSSIGRNFILTHHTAGGGHDGFCGQWTLEIAVMYPTLVKAGMRIGQFYFDKFVGKRKSYDKNNLAGYNNQTGPKSPPPIPVSDELV